MRFAYIITYTRRKCCRHCNSRGRQRLLFDAAATGTTSRNNCGSRSSQIRIYLCISLSLSLTHSFCLSPTLCLSISLSRSLSCSFSRACTIVACTQRRFRRIVTCIYTYTRARQVLLVPR